MKLAVRKNNFVQKSLLKNDVNVQIQSWEAECHNMDPTPELAAKNKTITALCIIVTVSWAVFIAHSLFPKEVSTG